ncbi:hypothetical protein [Kribbella amoyensis]|uniref:hypothetical protein n=1 Tax=Kribbella amoyensis TaxID=996641 RepID=UPI00119D5386|nr:hypothetical protein [Kribbella amoyensis]
MLIRTDRSLTGRAVAGLLRTPASTSGVQKVLDDLVRNGLVDAEPAGRAKLYRLNRDHVAYPAINDLVHLREILLARMRAEAEGWKIPAVAVWLFGPSARGKAGAGGELDVLVVRPDMIDDADPRWLNQLETLSEHASRWSGNPCETREYSTSELKRFVRRGERLIADLRRDAIAITGSPPRQFLTRKAG